MPPWEIFSSGAETYYFEFHQGHIYNRETIAALNYVICQYMSMKLK